MDLLFWLLTIGIAVSAAILGYVNPLALGAIAAAIFALIYVLKVAQHWRGTTLMLLLFLPFAAMPVILLQQSGWPVLLKDALFVAPIYLGAFVLYPDSRGAKPLPPPVFVGVGVLVALVFAQAVHSSIEAPLVALIGARTWLIYLPLLFVVPRLFVRAETVRSWIQALVVVALIPAVIGIAQAALVYAGYEDLVYAPYGGLAQNVTQGFAQVGVSEDLTVRRIPSTFTFGTQYYGFLLAMLPLAAWLWLSDFAGSRRWRCLGAIATVTLMAAGVTSGSRGFWVWGPALLGLTFVLGGTRAWRAALVPVLIAAGGLLAFATVVSNVADSLIRLGWFYVTEALTEEMVSVINTAGWWGLGVGTQTGSARYVIEDNTIGVGAEGWYAKALFELGSPGLAVIACLWVILLVVAWKARTNSQGGPFEALGNGLFAFALVVMINLYKGPLIDLDPLNVYFWFLLGLIITLPSLSLGAGDGCATMPAEAKDLLEQ